MNKLLSAVLALAIAGNAYLAWELNSRFLPSTADLDADLATVRGQRANLLKDRSTVADLSILDQTLAQTEAMLEQKRASRLRFVDVHYSISGRDSAPVSDKDLVDIDKEIDRQRGLMERSKTDSANYTGGLIQGILLLRIATEELTLAALQQRRLAMKYGLALPGIARTPAIVDVSVLSALDDEIGAKQAAVLRGEEEASRYTGGLAQAMIMSRVEAEKLTLAMLEQRRLMIKFDVGLPTLGEPKGGQSAPPKPPGRVVGDKEAIQ